MCSPRGMRIVPPQEQLSEAKCVLADTTGAIRIGALQTYLMGIDWKKQYAARTLSLPTASDAERVAVIGAGPAGLAAACALLELGITPVVFDTASEIGAFWQTAPLPLRNMRIFSPIN